MGPPCSLYLNCIFVHFTHPPTFGFHPKYFPHPPVPPKTVCCHLTTHRFRCDGRHAYHVVHELLQPTIVPKPGCKWQPAEILGGNKNERLGRTRLLFQRLDPFPRSRRIHHKMAAFLQYRPYVSPVNCHCAGATSAAKVIDLFSPPVHVEHHSHLLGHPMTGASQEALVDGQTVH